MRTAPAPEVGIELAQATLAAGRFDEALTCLSPLLPPRQADAVSACRLWLLSAEALVGLGRHAEARGHLIHAWVPPGPLQALPALRAHELRVRLRLGELPHLGDALAHCLDALGEDRAGRAELFAELARAYDDAGEREAALQCWEEALALSEEGGHEAHLQLGRLEHLRGNDAAALGHYAAAEGEEVSLRRALITGQSVEPPPSPLARVVNDFLHGSSGPEGTAAKALRLGSLALREGLGRDARDWLDRAAQLALEEGLPDVRRRALEGGARVAAEAEGDYRRARSLYEQAVEVGSNPEGLVPLLLAAACRRNDVPAAFEFSELQRLNLAGPSAGEAWLRDRARPSSAALPHLARLHELQLALSPGQVFAAVARVGEEAWLLVCNSSSSCVSPLDEASGGRGPTGPCSSKASGGREPTGVQLPLEEALWRATEGADQLVWVADGPLDDVPVAALRRGGRYLVERVSVVHTLSGSLLVHQANHPAPWRWGRVVIVDGPEADGVAATFWFPTCLPSPDDLPAYLPSATLVHLPSGDAPDGDVAGLPLVVLGGGGYRAARALLSRGARSVVVGGSSTHDAAPLLWAFYRHRMTHPPGEALALAQRELLNGPPASWAGFAFFGDPLSLPAAGWLFGWLARWGQRRHAQLFPVPRPEASHAV